MQIIADYDKFYIEQPTAIAIGKFDGVHIGHKALIAEIVKAKEQGYKAVVFTFSPLPAVYFGYGDTLCLTTKLEKEKQLEALGVDYLLEYPMNEQTASIEPDKFITEVLCERLNAGLIVAGPDLSFGNKGKGNFELLNQYASECNYSTMCIEKICIDEKEISSTYVRQLIEAAEMEQVAKCLGEPYGLTGEVSHGKQLGRTIGMPTANLIPEKDKLLPPFGVYYSKVYVGDKIYNGMTNLGRKPTVNDGQEITSETYVFDFEGDLYGQTITVKLCKFRRGEKKFSSVEELKENMQRDIDAGKEYFTEEIV